VASCLAWIHPVSEGDRVASIVFVLGVATAYVAGLLTRASCLWAVWHHHPDNSSTRRRCTRDSEHGHPQEGLRMGMHTVEAGLRGKNRLVVYNVCYPVILSPLRPPQNIKTFNSFRILLLSHSLPLLWHLFPWNATRPYYKITLASSIMSSLTSNTTDVSTTTSPSPPRL
jgi:hypothetical protein